MQRDQIEHIIIASIEKLIHFDMDIIQSDSQTEIIESIPEKAKLERKLHEVCINHRLAVYLEEEVRIIDPSYFVDIEYNRYYRNEKYVNTKYFIESLRPDILIHKRMSNSDSQHLLVIEAKKDKTDEKDERKIKALMIDEHYRYLFGARIRYNNFTNAMIDLYYHYANSIAKTNIPLKF